MPRSRFTGAPLSALRSASPKNPRLVALADLDGGRRDLISAGEGSGELFAPPGGGLR